MIYLFLLLFPLFSLAEIPDSLIRLSEIKNHDSEAYMFEAHKAAMDARHSAESALEGENSSLALKILSVGLKLMPHRDDLKNLRNTALDTYLSITKKLEEDTKKNCALLQERYQFLNTLAPDSLAKLTYDKDCGVIAKKEDTDYIRIHEPVLLKDLEAQYKADHIWKNTKFPFEDVLNNSFMLLRSLYGENFSLSCSGFKMVPGSNENNLIDAHSVCKMSGIDESFRRISYKYYSFLDQLLITPEGKKAVMYTTLSGVTKYFKTSDSLYQVYETAFDNEAFDDDISNFAVMNMNLKYKDKVLNESVLVKLDHKSFKKGIPYVKFERGQTERFEFIGKESTFFLMQEELKGLQDIQFTINYRDTFDQYKKSFEIATKADIECRDLQKKLTDLTSSRKKRKLEQSLKASCPEKGTLGAMIRSSYP